MRYRKLLALAAAAPLLGLPVAGIAVPALAQSSQTYTANLQPVPLNNQTSASGTLTLTLNGSVATIHEQVSGLAMTFAGKPYPHVQHIHGGALGACPTASRDANHDGVLSTTEGGPDYGPIQTTLSTSGGTTPASGTNLAIAPSGATINYDRTITLDSATMASVQKGIAVVVVHGLDPATAPKAAGTAKSDLVPSLPLAATSPALCGVLAVSTGGLATGGGSTAGTQDTGLFVLGGVALLGAAGVLAYRRRIADAA